MFTRPIATYTIAFLLIFSWWMLAFRLHEADEPKSIIHKGSAAHSRELLIHEETTCQLVEKEVLKRALFGDTNLMAELILRWDIEAKILEKDGVKGIKRLSDDKLIESQKIARLLHVGRTETSSFSYRSDEMSVVIDDMGSPFDLTLKREKILPQTYMAASILLALKGQESIIALPKGLKKQNHIYPSELTDSIPLEFDRYASEAICTQQPDIAFVSKYYSNPSSIDLLRSQEVDLFFVRDISSVEDLQEAINDISDVIGEPMKGRLLKTFVEAVFIAIDNWRTGCGFSLQGKKVMALTYYNRFFLPGKKTLTDHLLKRMGVDNYAALLPQDPRLESFSVPITEEEIAYFNPDLMIVLTDKPSEMEKLLSARPFLDEITAKIQNTISYISEDIQLTPSQVIALAYLDLNASVVKLFQRETSAKTGQH
ncbi:ABC transporter substrate-binding protein [Estrella lausannensis]|uniref:ABC-type transporter, substrate-binding protein n=1 Tax=Estrella lausannensis TaxID=483423 RepID=A0A0H5DQX0_9BACT|nr:ABC transporter substrate-binding protein [Estrella lausannensis]CRX38518.1 ABC-type transporter, substrate-binding protein [Estrella lausannensis]